MAKSVYVKEIGQVVDFPDTATPEQISAYIDRKFKPPVPPPPPEAGIGALESGFYGALGRAEAAGGKAAQGLGLESIASDLFNRSRANQEYAAKYKPDVASVQDIRGVGDVAKYAGSTLGQSATESAVGIGGAATGAVIGTALGGPVGALVGGAIGGALASLPTFVGGNLQAQAEAQNIPLEETSGYSASAGAAVQAPLDTAFDLLIAKRFGFVGNVANEARKGFFREVMKAAGEGALAEGLTEPAQQAIEIAQADPEKLLEFGPDVQNEILNAAAGGVLAGGTIGGAAETVSAPFKGGEQPTPPVPQETIDLASSVTASAKRGDEMKKFAEINAGVEQLASKNAFGSLGIKKIQLDPTPENGLSEPLQRFQVVDGRGTSIAEFSDPVNAADAISAYSKAVGKKIKLRSLDSGQEIETATPAAPVPAEVATPTVSAPEAAAETPTVGAPNLNITPAPEVSAPEEATATLPAIAVTETPESPVGFSEEAPVESVEAVAPVIPNITETPAPESEFEPIATPEEQEQARKLIQERKDKIATGVREALSRYNLKDVDTKFIPAFMDKMGRPRPVEGAEKLGGGKSIVTLATDIYDPALKVEDLTDRVIDVMNHESIHSAFDLGLIRPQEKAILFKAAERAKMPGGKNTYLDHAKVVYDPKRPGMEAYSNPDMVIEEAVAEMFRDWRKGRKNVPTEVRGLINRIIDSLRHIFNVMRRNQYENIFTDIERGNVGLRERAPRKTEETKVSIAPENPKLSVAPVYPFGQQVPQVNAAQINATLDRITYGAGVDMLERIGMSKTAKIIGKVVPDKFKPSRAGYTSFIQNFADKMLPVGQMVDYIKKNGGTVPEAFDAYMAEELMHGRVADSLEMRENNLYKPLMEHIKKSGLSIDEVQRYIYAKHAPERNAQIRALNPGADPSVGSGMSDETAKEIINSVMASPKVNDYIAAEKLFRPIIEDTNRLRVEAGLTPDFDNMMIEDESGKLVKVNNYKFYAPLRGFADESRTEGEIEDEVRARVGRGFKIRGREDMRAMGRSSEASDIIAHAILQNTEAVIRAAKNKVGQSFLGLIEANPKLAEDYGVEILTKDKKPLKRFISSKGVVKTMIDPMYKNSDDVMVVKRNGEEIPIRIDNAFLQKALLAKRSGSPEIADKALKALQFMNRTLAAMNTAYNPEFILINFPRDLQTAGVNIAQYEIDGIQKKVVMDAAKAVRGVFKMLRDPHAENEWTKWYNMFKEDGGKTSGFFGSFTLEDRLKKMEKIAQDVSGQPSHRVKQAFDFAKGYIEDLNGAFENATRLAVYKNLHEAGFSRERAAQAAKNLTVNFDKRGVYGPFMNSMYLFYNASVQGTLSMMMAAARSKRVRKIMGGIVVVGMMQDMINSLLSGEDEDGKNLYDKIPDYKLQTNMILMDPFGFTKSGYFAIPLPYGFNAFYNMGRATARTMRGEYKTSEAVTSMASTFVDAFNPVGGTESLLNFIAPTVLDPVVALSLNMDYSGRKIYPESFPGSVPKADSQMYWTTTSPAFRTVSDYLNWATGGSEYIPGMIDVSPAVLEYVYDYAMGGVGSFARRLVDTGYGAYAAAVEGDLSGLELNNIPILRKVYGNVSERMNFEDYFQKVNHVLARGEELKSAIQSGDADRIKSVRARFADEISIYSAVKTLAYKRNKLASDLKKLRENTKMPPEERIRRQDILQKQIEEITKRVNKLYEEKIGNKYPSFFS